MADREEIQRALERAVSDALRPLVFNTADETLQQRIRESLEESLQHIADNREPAITVEANPQPGDVEKGILTMKLKINPERALPHEIDAWNRMMEAQHAQEG